jgi:hypothetical protein
VAPVTGVQRAVSVVPSKSAASRSGRSLGMAKAGPWGPMDTALFESTTIASVTAARHPGGCGAAISILSPSTSVSGPRARR